MPLLDEVARLQALRDLAILDTAAEESFDELTRTAALVCQMPIALISLIDENRQWFKAKVGLDASETPRAVAFCDHAIRQSDELLEVVDATKDPRFSGNPLVTGAPDIRFYAGAPLVDAAGHALGTLCVIDRRVRQLEPWQREVLGNLARQVVRLFAARSLARGDTSSKIRAVVPTIEVLVRQVPSGAVAVGPHGRIQINQAACAIIGIPAAELPDLNAWFARLCGDQAQQIRASYDTDRAAGFPGPRQVWVTRGDGERRLVEFHGVHSVQGEMWLLRDVTDTVGAEERFRVLFEHSSDAHLLFDERGIIDCNQATITLLRGHDKRQVLSLHPAQLSPELQPDGRRSDEKCIEMDRLARERGYHRFEWQHRRMDGSDFPVEVTLTPVQIHGQPVLLVVWHDLTERKAAEQAERERERRWLLALEASGDGVWDWTIETNHVYFSPRWKAMLGHGDEEIGETLDEWDCRVHPDDKDATYAAIKQHLASVTPQYVSEHRVRCKDGSWKWILDRGMVMDRHPDGRPKRMIGTHSDLTERRRTEDSLRLEQERFRAMNDASPIGIFVTDVAGRATYLNDRWCALAGIAAVDGLGDGWSATLHPDDRERVFALWSAAVSAGKIFDAEYRFIQPTGVITWCQGMAAPMRIAGQVVGYVGSIADITERHQAEERLRESLHRFDLVASGAAIGIWETRFDPLHWREQLRGEQPFFWSRRFIEIMGYTAEEFPSRLEPWLTALHPQDHDRTMATVFDCLASGVPYNIEYRLRHKSGEYRWYHGTGEAERDAEGRPYRMAGSIADITARKRDEALIEIARAQLVDAIGNIDAGFAMFDAADQLIICNQRFGGIYGMDGSALIPGTSYAGILRMMEVAGVLQGSGVDPAVWIAERLANHVEPGPDREFLLAGRWIRLAERCTADGGIVSLHTDITVLKQAAEDMRCARDQAERAVRSKAEFLATMSHELRTPMNGVIGMTSLLLDTPLNNQQREFAGTVRLCGDQLLALINDILDFSKIEAGGLVLECIPFSPRKLAEDCVTLLADQAERKGLQLICLIAADLPARLLGDPTRLRQVLLNLIGNAVKFTERGEVVLSLTTNGTPTGGKPTIELAVRDTGIGIPAQARERLFKPFVQADSSTTRKYGGTGLGLVICQRLVQFMDGVIDLASQPGHGSTFTCRIPFDVAPAAEAEVESDGLVGQRALVIAASAAARRSLREQFIGWGMLCDETSDLGTARIAATANRPALVVIDDDIPGGGLELGKALGNDSALRGVPQVLLVGTAHRGMATSAKAAGIAGFLTKPVRHDQLFDCLLVVLQQACRVADRPAGGALPLVTRHSLAEECTAHRVLVVEDNQVNRQVAVMMLTKLGCHCDVATNGQEAIDAMARQSYHLVFMDCQMPVMDGFVATSEIRRREGRKQHSRIVALTANAMHGDRERCLAAGMDDYVTKPITAEALQAALARAHQQPVVSKAADTSPAVKSNEPVIDDAMLQSLLQATDSETVHAVAEMMHADAATALTEVKAAIATGDAVALSRTAHRLKGASGTLGMRQVESLCHRLEQAGRSRHLDQLPALSAALEQALGEGLLVLAAHPLVRGP